MSQISNFKNPWRTLLLDQQASFRAVIFHIETGGRSSGRRTVVHEYPKRPDEMGPYAEDMGRHARRFQFSGYLVYRPHKSGATPYRAEVSSTNPVLYDYVEQRQLLYEALEKPDVGKLIHPVFAPGGMLVMVERYTMTESRERGGYTQYEIQFVEGGKPTNGAGTSVDTKSVVDSKATAADSVWAGGTSPLTGLTQKSVM